jgi:rod shape-determining protein MreC
MRDTPRTRLLLGVTLIAALALIAVNYQNGNSPIIRSIRSAGGAVFGRAERAVSSLARPIGRFFDSGVAGTGSGGEVTALQRQLSTLRAQLSAAELARGKYRQLDHLLQLAGTGRYRIVAASVVAFGQGFQQTVTLDAGSADGVRPEQTVLNGDGLVGQVIAVSAQTCTVLLASAASSVVGVRLAPGGAIGWVSGQGAVGRGAGNLLVLQVPDPGAVLAVGTQLVTAASVRDRPFVPGVPVGSVVAVRNRAGALTAQAFVRPYVDLATLDVVGIVIAPPRVNPRFSVLPPHPTPKPTPTPTASRRRATPRPRH